MKHALCHLLAWQLLSACVTRRDQYYWGAYESMVHGSFETKEGTDPEAQVQRLGVQIDEAKEKGKAVPPGLYAHLGYMKHLSGDDPGAVEALTMEKTHYRSATVFVDRLIASLKDKKPAMEKNVNARLR